MSTDPAPSPPAIAATSISIKLPPFWPADPAVWFAQVEATFATKKLNAQKTRFEHVVASLSPEVATEVRDLVLRPPDTDQYDVLKATLIKRTEASEQRRFQQLLQAEDLGDRKPTQLLRRMHQLLGDHTGRLDETFLRELFLQRLPSNVRMVLAASPSGTSLNSLAELADKVTEVAAPQVSGINQPILPADQPPKAGTSVGNKPTSSDFERIVTELAELRATVKALAKTRSRSPSSGRHRHRSPTPTPPVTDQLCWYHQKFGNEARKCNSPCSYPN